MKNTNANVNKYLLQKYLLTKKQKKKQANQNGNIYIRWAFSLFFPLETFSVRTKF